MYVPVGTTLKTTAFDAVFKRRFHTPFETNPQPPSRDRAKPRCAAHAFPFTIFARNPPGGPGAKRVFVYFRYWSPKRLPSRPGTYLWSCTSRPRWPSWPRPPQGNGLVGFASCLFLPPCTPSSLLPVPLLGSLARHHLVSLHPHAMALSATAPSRDLHASCLEECRNLGWLGPSWGEATLENIYHVEVYWRRFVTGLLYWPLSVPLVRNPYICSPFSSIRSTPVEGAD